MADIELVVNTGDVLGEVPIWCPREGALYWMDGFKPALHRLDGATGDVTSWTPPEKYGSFALREHGGFVVAGRKQIALFDPETGAWDPICIPEPDGPDNFLNDGRCDRQGRFWVGSLSRMIDAPTGRLHRLDADHTLETVDKGIWVSNGVAFSADGGTMYFADSHIKRIYNYDIDPESGLASGKRVYADASDRVGIPDGATIDSEGCLWHAEFDFAMTSGSSFVVRRDPSGRIERAVKVPVSRPTSCVFGGPGLDILYITTASFRMDGGQKAAQPWAGGLLAVDVGVTGVAETRFAG